MNLKTLLRLFAAATLLLCVGPICAQTKPVLDDLFDRARQVDIRGFSNKSLPPVIRDVMPLPSSGARFEVSAAYPATLVYAIDGAAGERSHDPVYRNWLLGSGPEPDWLVSWRGARDRWNQWVPGEGGEYQPFLACSYEAVEIGAMLDCMNRVVPPEDRDTVRRAVLGGDALLRDRWLEISGRMGGAIKDLRAILGGPEASVLLEELRRVTRFSDSQPISFRVIMVFKPASEHTYAHQQGPYLVQEVDPSFQAGELVSPAFHEIAHLAVELSPTAPEMEAVFAGNGYAGLITANCWNESFATAFGNGLAASRLDPKFCEDCQMYSDPAIDTLGRELYRRWRSGSLPTFGPDFARSLVKLVEIHWPRGRWRVRDLFSRARAFGDDRQALFNFRNAARMRDMRRVVPLPESLDRLPDDPPTLPRLVVITRATAEARPDALSQLGVTWETLAGRLNSAGAVAHWSDDPQGLPLVLLAARDVPTLRAAATRLGALESMPGPGWTDLDPR